MLKAVKFRLYPTKEQEELLTKQFGCARFIYNWALDYSSWEYKDNNTKTYKNDWQVLLPKLKEYLPWLRTDSNSQSLVSELRHLDVAYTRFFKKLSGFPKFKSKYSRQSIAVPQKFSIKNGKLSIPKIKDIRVIVTKDVSNMKSVTVSKTKTNKYYVSILYDDKVDKITPSQPVKNRALGIDLGLKTFASLSSGEIINNPKFFSRNQKKLRRASKSFSRKQTNSFNRAKAKQKLAFVHEKIFNQRLDFIHKTTFRLVCKNQEINTLCVESLNIRGMLKNRNLSKAISDVSWGEFLRQIKYKCLWYGINILKCGQFDATSKTCYCCGWKNPNLKMKDRSWVCTSCNSIHDRDINAAKNIVNFSFKNIYSEDAEDFKIVEMEALVKGQYLLNETVVNEAINVTNVTSSTGNATIL